MELGTVVGNVWATRKADGIMGQKLLVIDLMQGMETPQKALVVAADVIGAGIGDMVLLSRGSSARLIAGEEKTPIDAAVIGIVDSLDIFEK